MSSFLSILDAKVVLTHLHHRIKMFDVKLVAQLDAVGNIRTVDTENELFMVRLCGVAKIGPCHASKDRLSGSSSLNCSTTQSLMLFHSRTLNTIYVSRFHLIY